MNLRNKFEKTNSKLHTDIIETLERELNRSIYIPANFMDGLKYYVHSKIDLKCRDILHRSFQPHLVRKIKRHEFKS